MTKPGDVFENPVTGERAVVRVGTEETAGATLVADLYIRPGGAVLGEHTHPAIEERFTVRRGRVFTKPPRIVQRLLFGMLAPVTRMRGLRGSYPEYLTRPPSARVVVEPWTGLPEEPASPQATRAS